MSKINIKTSKMSQKYLCLCQTISPVLCWSQWVGILPISSSKNKLNHLNIGCKFQISRFWCGVSIVTQLIFFLYIVCTTTVRIYIGSPEKVDKFDWYSMTMSYMLRQTDSLVSLLFGVLYTPRIVKILEKLSRLNGSLMEMQIISRQLKLYSIILFTTYIILLASYTCVAWTRRRTIATTTLYNILDSGIGLIIRGITCIYSQVQCVVVLMLCLLISSKCKHLSENVKSTMEQFCFYQVSNENKYAKNVKVSSLNWMAVEKNTPSVNQLIHINTQHQEVNHCLSEINHCFGSQLLVTFSANLFIIVFYLHRSITASDEYYVNHGQQRAHCILSLIYLFIKLLLYLYIGQKVSNMTKKPLQEIQRCNLLHLPIPIQQQIQTLILQWLSAESKYLSALNIIKIGPWLLAPIVGNTITYLLVAIQFKSDYDITAIAPE